MKRLFSLFWLIALTAQSQPLIRNSATTNSAPKLPNILANNTNPLYPVMILDPDGTGADREFFYRVGFSMTLSNLTLPGLLSLNARTNKLSIANDQLFLDGVAVSSSAAAPVNNFYTTNQFFVTGKGNTLIITNQLTLGYMTNKLLRVDENGVVTNAATADSNGIDLGNSTTSLKLADGSKAKPGLAFSVQTNLGIARLFDTTLSIVSGASNVADFGSGAFSSPAGLRLNMATASRFATFDGDKVVASSGTSANLSSTLTDETGTGAAVFGTAPTISGGNFLSGKADTLIVTQVVQSAWTTLTMTGSNVSAINLTNGSYLKLTLTTNAFMPDPINFPGTNFASTYQVHLLQDSTGGRTVMMTNSAWQVGTDHSTNAIPSITTNANAVSVLTFVTSPFSATKLYLVPTPF